MTTETEPPPGENALEERPRPLFGPVFWVALAFGLICVLAGWALARLGPKYL